MRFVSPALKHVVYPALAGTGSFRRLAPHGVSVVTYHGVQPDGYKSQDPALDGNLVSAAMLRRQLRTLKANYDVISPEDFRSWFNGSTKLPVRAVLLTCDDGLLNVLTSMLPILQEEDVKCIFFVTGASAAESPAMLWYEQLFLAILRAPAGKFRILNVEDELTGPTQRRAVWWRIVQRLSQDDANSRDAFLAAISQTWPNSPDPDRDAPPLQQRFRLLTRSQLIQLQAAGMTIGAHTMTHPILSRQPLTLARQEIAGSRSVLENALARPVWAFAYPFGDSSAVDAQAMTIAREAGLEAAFLNYGGGFSPHFDHFAIPRVHVTATMGVAEFEAHVAGFHSLLQRRSGRVPPGSAIASTR